MNTEREVTDVLNVLYIEDNASNVRLVERLMARRGHIRLHLPDLAGEAVLRHLLDSPDWGARPIVVLSADALPATEVRLRAAGAADYLTKPLDITRLYTCLDAAQATRRRPATTC